MIEVLREGNKMKIECNECGALLRYQINDIRTECICLAPRMEDIRKYIICPQCQGKIILEAKR